MSPTNPSPAEPLPLVGRADVLDRIDRDVARVRSGAFRAVLITGPAGIGKTRVAAEVLARHSLDFAGLSGRSFRLGETTSFGVWAEALDRHLRPRAPDELRELCGPFAAELASLVRSIEAVTPAGDIRLARGRLLEALVHVFDRLATERPVLVTLDDAHLADRSSWEALRYLGRRLADAPIGLVVTARAAELAGHPVAGEVLQALEDDDLLTRVELHPLDQHAVVALASAVLRREPDVSSSLVPAPLVEWLHERSQGHPLFVVSLLRALVDEGTDLAPPPLDRVPESLRSRVELEVSGLEARARGVLELLAVLDGRTELGTLAQVCDEPVDELCESLEVLCHARLVSEVASGPELTYEIAHPVVQDAIYEGIGGARRRSLHRVAAQTFAGQQQLGAAAAHYARAAERGDVEAVDVLCRAMRQAEERGLHQEALAVLRSLIDVLPERDPRWRSVLDAMTWQSEWVVSHLVERDADVAITAMRRIESVVEGTNDPEVRAAVQFHLASFLSFGTADIEGADRACREAVAGFAEAGSVESSLIARNELAWIRGCGGDLAGQVSLAREVLDEAAAVGSRRAETHASGCAAYALGLMGRFDDADELFRRSITAAQADGNSYRVVWNRAQRGLVLGLAGRLSEAMTAIEGGLDDDGAASDAMALENLAHSDWLRGRLAAGAATIERAALRRPVLGSRRRAWSSALAARLHAELGQLERARWLLDQASSTFGGRDLLAWSAWCPWSAGILAWFEQDTERGLEALSQAQDRLRTIGATAMEAFVLIDLAEVADAGGQRGVVVASSDRLAEIAREVDGELHEHLACVGSARASLVAGETDVAASRAADAAAGLTHLGYELHRATADEIAGRALLDTSRARAIEHLVAAAQGFDRCGASVRLDRTRERLARLGSRGRRAAGTVAGPRALTDREHEVAALAAGGYTAREIGERLFIGRRTVETHLVSIYGKLGVASKRELVQRAGALGLRSDPSVPGSVASTEGTDGAGP